MAISGPRPRPTSGAAICCRPTVSPVRLGFDASIVATMLAGTNPPSAKPMSARIASRLASPVASPVVATSTEKMTTVDTSTLR